MNKKQAKKLKYLVGQVWKEISCLEGELEDRLRNLYDEAEQLEEYVRKISPKEKRDATQETGA